MANGKVAHTLGGHSGGTNGLAFLSGNSLVSVGEDGCARLWNVARAACLHELPVDAEGADRCGALRWRVACGAGCGGVDRAGRRAGQRRWLPPAQHVGCAPCGMISAPGCCSSLLPVLTFLPTRRASRRGHCVNHLTVAPGAKSFACTAGRLVTIFSLGSSPQQAPAKRVLGPLESTVGGWVGALVLARLLSTRVPAATLLCRCAAVGRRVVLPWQPLCCPDCLHALAGPSTPAGREPAL